MKTEAILITIIGVLSLIVFFILSSMSPEETCPNYGYIPVDRNGSIQCIPWEEVE